ncbi:solute carrier family 66 member 3-like isoform X2 [Mya arenaria]|uniref:solute carrier family 66 member 3-like isoform X2 n=1 Tax=Mya arenaria TaxID=6604 RepID=UPI0022E6D99D|nr:solute carrier family 66 member 3-like isoform X2 [Mya arenaria]
MWASTEDLCNFLSLTVVSLCIIMKVPQIWSAFKTGNTHGISLKSVLLEQTGYSIMLSYSFAMEYPVTTYLETAFLLVQNFFMLALIVYTRDLLSPKVILILAVYLSWVSSKFAQILDLYRQKEPGRLSAMTWSIAGYGCFVRVLTNIVQTGDWFIVLNFSCGATLNTTIVAMILYYTHQKKSKLF